MEDQDQDFDYSREYEEVEFKMDQATEKKIKDMNFALFMGNGMDEKYQNKSV